MRSNVISIVATKRRRTFVTLIARIDGTFTVRRTLPDGSRHPKGDEHFDDRSLATWCAEQASQILGYPLRHSRGGRDD
jgi:hypothetical protein